MLRFRSKYEKFWDWFQANEEEVFDFDANQDSVFDKLAAQLGRVHPDLVFEFSGINEGRREFVISAAGIRKAFPEVTALVRDAPTLARWKVLAFRQRHGICDIQCGDISVKGKEVFFSYISNADAIDLTLFLPGLVTASATQITGFKTAGYLLLDSAIGEYDVETKIAGIEFVDSAAFPERMRFPLSDLPGVVDSLPNSIH